MDNDKRIPNGLMSWAESHFLIVTAINSAYQDESSAKVLLLVEQDGIAGLFNLAYLLTIEFERQYSGSDWEVLDFYETMERFMEKML